MVGTPTYKTTKGRPGLPAFPVRRPTTRESAPWPANTNRPPGSPARPGHEPLTRSKTGRRTRGISPYRVTEWLLHSTAIEVGSVHGAWRLDRTYSAPEFWLPTGDAYPIYTYESAPQHAAPNGLLRNENFTSFSAYSSRVASQQSGGWTLALSDNTAHWQVGYATDNPTYPYALISHARWERDDPWTTTETIPEGTGSTTPLPAPATNPGPLPGTWNTPRQRPYSAPEYVATPRASPRLARGESVGVPNSHSFEVSWRPGKRATRGPMGPMGPRTPRKPPKNKREVKISGNKKAVRALIALNRLMGEGMEFIELISDGFGYRGTGSIRSRVEYLWEGGHEWDQQAFEKAWNQKALEDKYAGEFFSRLSEQLENLGVKAHTKVTGL